MILPDFTQEQSDLATLVMDEICGMVFSDMPPEVAREFQDNTNNLMIANRYYAKKHKTMLIAFVVASTANLLEFARDNDPTSDPIKKCILGSLANMWGFKVTVEKVES